MSARRPPSAPPELPGFTYEALLGSGGFADVFLYQQLMPQRRVAVKVLLTERMTRGSADAFDAEANIMARLSTHPAIVTIYQAGVSTDGRPYLVMEYCPKPNLQVRYRREPFSVAESLRVGVQVAAAVETAHRAGILHRDIKPANILVTEYNRPALTDFGIAVAAGADAESAGMSIPWSPPEAFADANGAGPASDVWALGATVYTLLAGRSPFEVPGGRNGSADLIQRIESAPLAPLARPDAPESLQRLLERSMAKAPGARYASALDFARALQRVQIELSMSATPIDVLDDSVDAVAPEDEDGALTRIRNVVSIDPTRPSASSAPTNAAPTYAAPTYAAPVTDTTQQAAGATVPRFALGADVVDSIPTGVTPTGPPAPATVPSSADATVRRPSSIEAQRPVPPSPAPASTAPAAVPDAAVSDASAPVDPRRGRLGLIIGIAAAVVVLGGVGIAWAVASGTVPDPAAQTSAPAEDADPIDVLPGSVPVVTDLTGTREGDQVVFTWTNPAPEDGDKYIWGVQRLGGAPSLQTTDQTTVTVPAEASGSTCIEVTLRRADGTASDPDRPAQACTS